jgi:hypothetical protein
VATRGGDRGVGVSGPTPAPGRHGDDPPPSPSCADCGAALRDPFGWCSSCRTAYCFPCGRRHFCTPECLANGCHAGLCVREVRGGILSAAWGLPE